ncbi:WD40 repeat-like protein [Suillus weaverae]|nr:WD40 repeat-like protein [Suillus weaverae]
MSSKTSTNKETPVVAPCQTIQGHTDYVQCVVHLPGGRRIITCSWDGSLRLWDLESGAQIGEDWRDEGKKKAGVYRMALSPNGKTVVSGNSDGEVKLWDVETGKVIGRWTGHAESVLSVCWSVDGKRVLSASWDGTARVWDVKSGKTIMEIKTGHKYVWVVIYSPNNTQIATGGYDESAAKIWDTKTGELLATLKHDNIVCSLAWTSDRKKLISGSRGPIRIFDTATWQEIAILEGHTWWVNAISLSRNERLLASASWDKTARLWNLDTNLPVGPPLQHKDEVECATLSTNGKVLVTGCGDNVYLWDVHAIKDLPPPGTDVQAERSPRASLSNKSFLEVDATRCHNEFGDVDIFSPRFFDGMEPHDDISPMGGAHPHPSASALLARLVSFLHRFRHENAEANELPQSPTLSGLYPRVLFPRLSSLIHRSPLENDASNELQQLSTPSRFNSRALFARLSSLLPRSRLNTDEETELYNTTPSSSRPDALMDILSSLVRSQPRINEELEFSQRATRPHAVEVAPIRDREVLFVAARPQPTQPNRTTTPGARPAYSLPVRLLAHLVLFLCCASPQHADASAQSTQPHGQSQGPVHAQATSSQNQPTAPSTSATPTALDTHTTAPVAATAQPRPLPLRTRFVLFLCCASPPHAGGH